MGDVVGRSQWYPPPPLLPGGGGFGWERIGGGGGGGIRPTPPPSCGFSKSTSNPGNPTSSRPLFPWGRKTLVCTVLICTGQHSYDVRLSRICPISLSRRPQHPVVACTPGGNNEKLAKGDHVPNTPPRRLRVGCSPPPPRCLRV